MLVPCAELCVLRPVLLILALLPCLTPELSIPCTPWFILRGGLECV